MTQPPLPPPLPAERLARLIAALCAAVAARLERPGRPGLAGPLILLVCTRLRRMAQRVTRLAARVEAGTLPPPRRPASRRPHPRRPDSQCPDPTGTAAQPFARLLRRRSWLVRLVQETAFARGQVRTLLDTPEMAALIAAAPQIGRTLRPLCRMLGVDPPPALRRPPRAARPPASRAAKAANRPPPVPPGAAPPPPPHRPPLHRPPLHRPSPAPEVAGHRRRSPVRT